MGDPGKRVVDAVYQFMKIDRQWSVRDRQGFTWWGKDYAQRVWADPPIDDDGFRISRLHARTDLLTGYQGTPELIAKLAALNCFALLSALVPDPESPARVRLACSMYVHEGTLDWVLPLFSIAVAMQAAGAWVLEDLYSEMLALQPDSSSHPVSGPRPETDDMLNILAALASKSDDEDSDWAGKEMASLEKVLQRGPCLLANSDASGLTAEFPFCGQSSLLQARADQPHPQLGKGLLLLLKLPVGGTLQESAQTAADLNRRELTSLTRSHFLGSWCANDQGPCFTAFYPNAAHRTGLLTNLVLSMALRARWVAEKVYGDNWENSAGRAKSGMQRFLEMLGGKEED